MTRPERVGSPETQSGEPQGYYYMPPGIPLWGDCGTRCLQPKLPESPKVLPNSLGVKKKAQLRPAGMPRVLNSSETALMGSRTHAHVHAPCRQCSATDTILEQCWPQPLG